jgi:hypothetical protein
MLLIFLMLEETLDFLKYTSPRLFSHTRLPNLQFNICIQTFIQQTLMDIWQVRTRIIHSSDHFDINWFPADFLIIEQGEAANSLYLILSGTVDVIHEEADGTLQVLVCAGILVRLDDELDLIFRTQSSFWVMTSATE